MNAVGKPAVWRWVCLALATLCFAAVAAGADVSHRVSFSAGPQIMVWSADGVQTGPEVSLMAQAGSLLQAGPAAATGGLLVPVSAPADSSTTRHTLQIATNTPWQLEATSRTGEPVVLHISRGDIGAHATARSLTLSPVQLHAVNPHIIARQTVRTAQTRGAPQKQAITLHVDITPGAEVALRFSPLR